MKKESLRTYAKLALVAVVIGCAARNVHPPEFDEIALSEIHITGELPAEIIESSGQVVTAKGTLIGHNDSGTKPIVYEYGQDGTLIREVEVAGARNTDWEDMAIGPDQTVYIADVGNNSGRRKRLTIYKFPWPEDKNVTKKAVEITFEYPDRHGATPKRHNYDCEALVVSDGQLWIFSKNHGDHKTSLYSMPDTEGHHIARHVCTFDTHGLVTSADLNGESLVLLGYNYQREGFSPFIWYFKNWNGADLNEAPGIRKDIPLFVQAEAITMISPSEILFTNEEEEGGIGMIRSISISSFD